MSNFQKSGIGSCIAPKAELAQHPAKGKFNADNAIRSLQFWSSIQLVGAPDQVAAGVTWLYTCMQMWLCSILGCCNCGVYRRNTNVTKWGKNCCVWKPKFPAIERPWTDVALNFPDGMFSLLSECFLPCQDVFLSFRMYASLSECFLPYQDVFFPVRMYFSLSESISSVGLYCSLSRCFLLCYFSVRIYSSLSGCILLLIDHTEWSDFLFYQDIRIYNLDIYT